MIGISLKKQSGAFPPLTGVAPRRHADRAVRHLIGKNT